MPSPLRAREHEAHLFIEDEQRAALAARHCGSEIVKAKERLSGARRSDDERARSRIDPAAEQGIEFTDAAAHHSAGVFGPVLGRDEARKYADTARREDEVMIAAAEILAAAFDDAQTPPLAAIDRRELVEMDDAVGDAVDGAIGALRRQVVEHDHGGIVPGKIVLEREDLAAVAQRALREQANFRQAVDHDPLRLQPFDRIEDAIDRLAKFEVGGIEQALMLVGIEHARRRRKLDDFDVLADRPAMRSRAVAQLDLGFGEAEVDSDLTGIGPADKKLQGNGGFTGPGTSLQEMQTIAGEAAL